MGVLVGAARCHLLDLDEVASLIGIKSILTQYQRNAFAETTNVPKIKMPPTIGLQNPDCPASVVTVRCNNAHPASALVIVTGRIESTRQMGKIILVHDPLHGRDVVVSPFLAPNNASDVGWRGQNECRYRHHGQ